MNIVEKLQDKLERWKWKRLQHQLKTGAAQIKVTIDVDKGDTQHGSMDIEMDADGKIIGFHNVNLPSERSAAEIAERRAANVALRADLIYNEEVIDPNGLVELTDEELKLQEVRVPVLPPPRERTPLQKAQSIFESTREWHDTTINIQSPEK